MHPHSLDQNLRDQTSFAQNSLAQNSLGQNSLGQTGSGGPLPTGPGPDQAFDRDVFDRTATLLTAEERDRCIRTLADRAMSLKILLRPDSPGPASLGPDMPKHALASLADEAHTLAGSAGLLGFRQVERAARQMEASLAGGSVAPAHTTVLIDALTAMQETLRHLQPPAAPIT
jgi:HPt (histidine-containing phosphotransfer) domain-containing protein